MGFHLTLSRGPEGFKFWSHHEKKSPLKRGERYLVSYDPGMGDPLEPQEMTYKGMSRGDCVFIMDDGDEWPMDVFYYKPLPQTTRE